MDKEYCDTRLMYNNIKFAAALNEIYKDCEIEEALGLSKGYICNCKKGKRHFTYWIIQKAAEVFNVSVYDLFEEDFIKNIQERVIN